MTQVLFASATAPLETDLDANFTEVYTRTQLLTSTTQAVGFTVTPSAWGVLKAIEGGAGAVAFNGTAATYLTQNAYFNGSSWIYKTAGAASVLVASGGGYQFNIAASGAAGAAAALVQAVTLDIAGNWLLGTTTAPSGVPADPVGAAIFATGAAVFTRSGVNSVLFVNNKQAGSVGLVSFLSGGATVGSISSNGTNTAYNTSSDYRLKDNVELIAGSGTFIDALKPCTWTWKSDGSAGSGFIAHELQAVSPGSVTGTKDATHPVGTYTSADGATVETSVPQPAHLEPGASWVPTGTAPTYQAVEYGSSEVIAMLVAELQDVRHRLRAANL